MTDVRTIRHDTLGSRHSEKSLPYLRAVARTFKAILRTPVGGVSVAVLLILFLFSFVGPVFYQRAPDEISVDYLSSPSAGHLAGTDTLGRDTLARLMHGGRISFTVAVASGLLGLLIAFPLGVMSGYARGITDNVVMRIMDTIYSFPTILLALGIVAVMGRGLDMIIIAISISGIPPIARIVRGQALAVRETEYIQSARSSGASHVRILALHISPNILSPAIVQVTIVMSRAILTEASLAFLGAGVAAPQATWGGMLLEAFPRMRLEASQAFIPGLFVVALVLALNMFGDVVRDVLDPRLKGA